MDCQLILNWATSFAKKWYQHLQKLFLHLEAQMLRMVSAWITFHTCNVEDILASFY
jgi:hypothetical protein